MRGFIGLIMMAVAAGSSQAAEPTETITVTGTATAFAKPDAARIHYIVRVSDASADAARDTATKQVATIDQSIKGLKLANLSTTTGAVSFGRASSGRGGRGGGFGGGGGGPGFNPGGPAGLGPYSAQVPLTAIIVEKDNTKLRTAVDALIAKLVEAGANVTDADADAPFSPRGAISSDTQRIDWFLNDDSTARREALRAAVRNAKGDAEAIAKELGWEKVNIVSVTDGPSSPRDLSEPAIPATRAPAGMVAVPVRVTVKCSR